MPLPSPKKGQKQDEFISSCMSSEIMKKDYPDNKQRLAVCFSQYTRKKKKQEVKGGEEPTWDDNESKNFIILP